MRGFARVVCVCVSTALGVCGVDLYASAQSNKTVANLQTLDRPLSEAQWASLIEKDPFFEGYRDPLTDSEKYNIALALKSYGQEVGKVMRAVRDFPGNQLVMGTGWALTRYSIVGLTDKGDQVMQFHLSDAQIQAVTNMHFWEESALHVQAKEVFKKAYGEALESPRKLEDGRRKMQDLAHALTFEQAEALITELTKATPRFNENTGVRLTPEEVQVYASLLETLIQVIAQRKSSGQASPRHDALEALKKKWYTVDLDASAMPDLVGSVTSVADMAALPDHRFELVYYENVNYNVFLDPQTLRIASRITKPGGTIRFTVAPNGTRLVAYMLHKSAWQGDPQIARVLAATGTQTKPIVDLKPR